jgi:hypothetical protein
MLRMLMEKELVRTVGRQSLPGKPLIYGTTKKFLEVFGLKELGDLPTLEELQPLQLRENLPQDLGDALAEEENPAPDQEVRPALAWPQGKELGSDDYLDDSSGAASEEEEDCGPRGTEEKLNGGETGTQAGRGDFMEPAAAAGNRGRRGGGRAAPTARFREITALHPRPNPRARLGAAAIYDQRSAPGSGSAAQPAGTDPARANSATNPGGEPARPGATNAGGKPGRRFATALQRGNGGGQ